MLSPTLSALGLVLLSQWQVQPAQVSLPGHGEGLYAADYNGDGWRDAVLTFSQRGQRFVAVVDGKTLRAGVPPVLRPIAIPRGVSFFDLCPALGPGLILASPDKLERLSPDGELHYLATLKQGFPFAEREGLERVDLCIAPANKVSLTTTTADPNAARLLVPGLGRAQLLRQDGSLIALQLPQQVHMLSGERYRGPRARRDLSLLTMLIAPRQYAGALQAAQHVDIAASLEDRLVVFLAADLDKASAAASLRPSFEMLVGPRSRAQRHKHQGLVDIQLADLTGDDILDAVVSYQRGASRDMRSRWQVLAGPFTATHKPRILMDQSFAGLAAPLLLTDLDSDGRQEVLEPHIDTGIVAMGKALITGTVPVSYRAHSFVNQRPSSSHSWTHDQAVDLSDSSSIAGALPIVDADFDGDGQCEFVVVDKAQGLQIYPGQAAPDLFAKKPAVSHDAASTRWAVSLRHGRQGAAVILLLHNEQDPTVLELFWVRNALGRRGR